MIAFVLKWAEALPIRRRLVWIALLAVFMSVAFYPHFIPQSSNRALGISGEPLEFGEE